MYLTKIDTGQHAAEICRLLIESCGRRQNVLNLLTRNFFCKNVEFGTVQKCTSLVEKCCKITSFNNFIRSRWGNNARALAFPLQKQN